MGFAFLGVVIGYLPTLYNAFSRREIEISLLDAWAGSPPAAAEVLQRLREIIRIREVSPGPADLATIDLAASTAASEPER